MSALMDAALCGSLIVLHSFFRPYCCGSVSRSLQAYIFTCAQKSHVSSLSDFWADLERINSFRGRIHLLLDVAANTRLNLSRVCSSAGVYERGPMHGGLSLHLVIEGKSLLPSPTLLSIRCILGKTLKVYNLKCQVLTCFSRTPFVGGLQTVGCVTVGMLKGHERISCSLLYIFFNDIDRFLYPCVLMWFL